MASATPSPIPASFQAGMGQDQPWQPLFECGNGNPAFYHQWFDDFDEAFHNATNNVYVLSGTSATLASAAGPGGLVTLSTEAVIDQIAQIQLNTVGQFTQNIAPKKLFFELRTTANANAANAKWLIGLCNIGAAITAATGAVAVTDGVYLLYTGSTGVLTLNQAVGSVVTSTPIPAGSFTVGAALQLDLAFFQNRAGDIQGFADQSLVGYIPQSMLGDPGGPQNSGSTARISGGTYTPTAVNLSPTVCVWTGSAAAASLTMDFITASQER